LLWVLPVWGQTDAGIIEKSLRKSRPEFQSPPEVVVPDIQIEDSRELIDAGAGPTFFVREIKLTGNTLISSEELAPLLALGEGEDMILGILTLYANEVSAVYAVQGYFLARAFIPAQKFRDGVGNFTLDSGVTVKTTTGDIDIAGIEIIENGTLNASGDVIQNGIITQLNASDQSGLDSATDSTFVDNFLGPGVGC
jgi:hemolysin activation/secretion protein